MTTTAGIPEPLAEHVAQMSAPLEGLAAFKGAERLRTIADALVAIEGMITPDGDWIRTSDQLIDRLNALGALLAHGPTDRDLRVGVVAARAAIAEVEAVLRKARPSAKAVAAGQGW